VSQLEQQRQQISEFDGLVIVDPPLSGERNMAIDEALLQNVQPDWPIVLRVYRWERPTLSLGHFQRIEDRLEYPLLHELPWVRRKTGGGAIVHDQELTYSVLIPTRDNLPAKGHSEPLYRGIHSAFVEKLLSLGWNAELSESCTCSTSEGKNSDPFLCFLRRSPVDIIIGFDKILGSAQRRSTMGLLQHGSLLLRRSQYTPGLNGLLDTHRESCPVKKLRDDWTVDASHRAVCDPLTEDEMNRWCEWAISTLKAGMSKRVEVSWKNGRLSDLIRKEDQEMRFPNGI